MAGVPGLADHRQRCRRAAVPAARHPEPGTVGCAARLLVRAGHFAATAYWGMVGTQIWGCHRSLGAGGHLGAGGRCCRAGPTADSMAEAHVGSSTSHDSTPAGQRARAGAWRPASRTWQGSSCRRARASAPVGPIRDDPSTATVGALEDHHVRFADAEYWVAHELDDLSDERLQISTVGSDQDRWPAQHLLVRNAPTHAWLFTTVADGSPFQFGATITIRGPNGMTETRFLAELRHLGVEYRVVHAGLLRAVIPDGGSLLPRSARRGWSQHDCSPPDPGRNGSRTSRTTPDGPTRAQPWAGWRPPSAGTEAAGLDGRGRRRRGSAQDRVALGAPSWCRETEATMS